MGSRQPAAVLRRALHERPAKCLPGVRGRRIDLSFEDSTINSLRTLLGSQLDFRAMWKTNIVWAVRSVWMHECVNDATTGGLTANLAAIPTAVFRLPAPTAARTGASWAAACAASSFPNTSDPLPMRPYPQRQPVTLRRRRRHRIRLVNDHLSMGHYFNRLRASSAQGLSGASAMKARQCSSAWSRRFISSSVRAR